MLENHYIVNTKDTFTIIKNKEEIKIKKEKTWDYLETQVTVT